METQETTKFLKLPFSFDVDRLEKDLKIIAEDQWNLHHYKMNFEGEWTSVSLYAADGDEKNIFANADASTKVEPTPVLKKCAYLKQVVEQFHCPLIAVRLLKLSAGSEIKPHQDYKLGYEDDNFRLHIPIVTNEKVEFILAGQQMMMQPGECWYTNVNYTHSVANHGKEDRVHLVIDGERNAWSDDLFFVLAPRETFNLREDQMNDQTIRRMIEELDHIGSPVSKAWIEKLKKQLKN